MGQQMPCGQHIGRLVEPVVGDRLAEQTGELRRHVAQLDAVLRALGASQAGRHIAQVQRHHLRIINVTGFGHPKQALCLEVRFKRFNFGFGAACAFKVSQRFFINGKETHGGTVFWRHIADGGAVRQAQAAGAFTKKFNKLAHHFFTPQLLGHAQHQVGCGHAFPQCASQLKADNIGC